MSNILITGARGFLGHHLTKEMVNDKLFTPTTSRLDLLREDAITNVVNYISFHQIDTVIHLAAKCGGIGFNKELPGVLIHDNAKMGLNILEACRIAKVNKVITLGSICAYPKVPKTVPFVESELFDGLPEETNSYYGESKRLLLMMGQAYRKQYGINIIHLMPTNMFGEQDHFEREKSHVIPALLVKLQEAKEHNSPYVQLWGTGKASREFLYAGDCAKAIVLALNKYNGAEPVNIGTGTEITISELANKIKEIVGYEGQIIWDPSKPDGQPRRCLNTSRAKSVFDFEAKTSFDEGLRKTYEWFIDRWSNGTCPMRHCI